MHLIQMCNVGNIVGGTAACAWSVTRALPDAEHTIIFRSSPTEETRAALAHCQVVEAKKIEKRFLENIGGDILLLHNISPENVYWNQKFTDSNTPVLQYIHSAMKQYAGADLTVACSLFLTQKLRRNTMQVVYQGVPHSENMTGVGASRTEEEFIVGRICTPCLRKWPQWQVPFYQRLSQRNPAIRWEFVGCPEVLRPELFKACGQRAKFHEAGWDARRHFNRWHAILYHNPDVEETFGRTVAEAMRAGAVPIVDHLGGFREQINLSNGYLCCNEHDFQMALKSLSSFDLWKKKSSNCQETAQRLFSFQSFRSRLLNTFLSVAELHSVRKKRLA